MKLPNKTLRYLGLLNDYSSQLRKNRYNKRKSNGLAIMRFHRVGTCAIPAAVAVGLFVDTPEGLRKPVKYEFDESDAVKVSEQVSKILAVYKNNQKNKAKKNAQLSEPKQTIENKPKHKELGITTKKTTVTTEKVSFLWGLYSKETTKTV